MAELYPLFAASCAPLESDDGSRDNGRPGPPEGWCEIPTGLSETRLYRVVPPEGGDIHWQAEMTLDGEVLRRRCASELHARWWLAASMESSSTPSIFDGEELNARLRAGFVRSE